MAGCSAVAKPWDVTFLHTFQENGAADMIQELQRFPPKIGARSDDVFS
jgi:hypothetical protein